MTYEEINNELSSLLESYDYPSMCRLMTDNAVSFESFSPEQKYIISEKVLIIQYKNGELSLCESTVNYMRKLSVGLPVKYLYTATFWYINILIEKKRYRDALRRTNSLLENIGKNRECSPLFTENVRNMLIRIYIHKKNYHRFFKECRKLLSKRNLLPESRIKLFMSMGLVYAELGKENSAIRKFHYIIHNSDSHIFKGRAFFYIGNLEKDLQTKRNYYCAAQKEFGSVGNNIMIDLMQARCGT